MKFIKVLNNPNGVKCMSGTFAIYEMETAAELKAAHGHKYLVNRKFTESAMTEMDVIEDLILGAVKDSEYVYGVGFCDTIRECELFYTAACLQMFLYTFRYMLKDFVEQSNGKSAQAESLENVDLRCSATVHELGQE